MRGTAPFTTLKKSYPAHDVDNVELGNPCRRVDKIMLFIIFSKCLIFHAALWRN